MVDFIDDEVRSAGIEEINARDRAPVVSKLVNEAQPGASAVKCMKRNEYGVGLRAVRAPARSSQGRRNSRGDHRDKH